MLQFVIDKCIICITKTHLSKLGLGNGGLWFLTCTGRLWYSSHQKKETVSLHLKQSAPLTPVTVTVNRIMC